VRITNAGATFFQQARDGLRLFEGAVKTAGAAGRGGVGRLDIGILSSMASGFLRELIEAYSTRHPDVIIQVYEGTSAEQIALIRRRQLDVGFVVDVTGAADCDMAPLWRERLFVVLPEGHALCNQSAVEWADLRKEHFVTRQSELFRFCRAAHQAASHRIPALFRGEKEEVLDVKIEPENFDAAQAGTSALDEHFRSEAKRDYIHITENSPL
jgi:DNA-binding transcriptional LysR family regulator